MEVPPVQPLDGAPIEVSNDAAAVPQGISAGTFLALMF